MAFITIHPTEGLSAAELERAIKTGPPEVWTEAPHEEMLASAGFIDVEAIDVTAAFSLTQQAWVDGWREHEDELVDLLGTHAFEERKAERQAMRSAIDERLLRRTLFTARTPEIHADIGQRR